MKKKVLILTAVAAMCMLASCSNKETVQEDTTEAVEIATEEVSEEASAQEESVLSDENDVQDESTALTDEDVTSIEIKFFNKTGEAITDAKVIEDDLTVEGGSVDADNSFSAVLEKDTEDLKLEFTIGEETTRLPLELGVLDGFNVVIESDDADGYMVEYIGIDEEA